MPRLKATYDSEIVTKLLSKLSLKNKHDVPKKGDGRKISKCCFVLFPKKNENFATNQY